MLLMKFSLMMIKGDNMITWEVFSLNKIIPKIKIDKITIHKILIKIIMEISEVILSKIFIMNLLRLKNHNNNKKDLVFNKQDIKNIEHIEINMEMYIQREFIDLIDLKMIGLIEEHLENHFLSNLRKS